LGNGEIIGCGGWNLADTEWQVSFLAGYAGTDFIENLYKIKISKEGGLIMTEISRRDFLKLTGAAAGAIAIDRLGIAGKATVQAGRQEVSPKVESSPIFDPILTRLTNEYWRESGNWEGDMMEDAPSFAPRVLYKLGNAEAGTKADRTVEYEVDLADKVLEQLKTDPNDTEKLKQLIYPVAMGHASLMDGFRNYGGDKQEIKTKLEVYSQGGVFLSALALIFVDPAEIDKNLPEGFPFNRIQAHAFTADACFQLGEITRNQAWSCLGTYLTDRMVEQFYTENGQYGGYLTLKPSEGKPPEDWNQGYSLVPLAEAFKFTNDQKYLEKGRQIVDTSLRHLEDKQRGGFATAPLSQSKHLSGNCAMLRGMKSWASLGSSESARVGAAITGTLSFLQKDLYNDGLLYHHWSAQAGRADYFCTGCNFFALSGIQDSKPFKYNVLLPYVASEASAQHAQATIRQGLSYNEWRDGFRTDKVEEQAHNILKNPIGLLDQRGLKNGLDLLELK